MIGGLRVAVVGTVSMDFVTADVTAVPGVEVGDEVVAIGRQGEAVIGADEIAESLDTIAWEVLCDVGPRVVRRHISGRQAATLDAAAHNTAAPITAEPTRNSHNAV